MQQGSFTADLAGHLALVTGGASGIGAAVSRALAAAGAAVAINYYSSEQSARQLVAALEAAGAQARAFRADVSIPEQIARLFADVQEQMGRRVSILVNNAGTQLAAADLEQMTLELWDRTLALNVTSALVCAQQAAPAMKKQRWGRIINITSISARSGGGPGGLAYASSKGAMDTLTKALAKDLGPHGITVNGIAPGVILTALHERFSTPEKLEALKAQTALCRLGQAEDVAGAVVFLASAAAGYITGATIPVNGGLRMD